MTTIDQGLSSRRPFFLIRPAHALVAYLAKLRAEAIRRQQHRRALLYLADLSDWQLDDIGLERHEVQQALYKAGIRPAPDGLFDGRR